MRRGAPLTRCMSGICRGIGRTSLLRCAHDFIVQLPPSLPAPALHIGEVHQAPHWNRIVARHKLFRPHSGNIGPTPSPLMPWFGRRQSGRDHKPSSLVHLPPHHRRYLLACVIRHSHAPTQPITNPRRKSGAFRPWREDAQAPSMRRRPCARSAGRSSRGRLSQSGQRSVS